jgi:uncharacterized membrane protein
VSAEVEAAVPRRGALPRLPWVLLALSLALNLFFIGGVFWVRNQAAQANLTPPERFAMVASQLSLDANQKAAFQRFVRDMRMRTRQLRETNQPLIQETWEELAKTKPDDALIDHNLDEAASNRHSYQLETSHALRTFLAALSPEQRQQFIELARNRQDHGVPPLLHQLAP